MEQNQYIVAFEIGSSKIVGAIAEKSQSGMVSVIHLVAEKLNNCVRYGIVQNVENVKSSINRMLKNLEDRAAGRITEIYVGMSGRSLHSVVKEKSRAIDATKPITPETVDSIIREVARETVKNYETVDVVPRSYSVDKNTTDDPVGLYGETIKIKANLIVARPTLKQNLTRVTNFGIKVKDYIVTPLAVAEQVLTDNDRLGCMLIDMGAETTAVSIYKDGELAYMATLPLGGRNITRDITNGMSVLEDTAERVKKNINNPLDPDHVDNMVIEGVSTKDAANYIAARNSEILANIKNQLTLAGMSTDDIRTVVVIGGASQLQGLAKKIEETMNLNVRMGHQPQSLNILNHNYNHTEYIEVFSLLLKAAELIKPGETCVERRIYDDGPVVIKEPEVSERNKDPEPKPEKKSRSNWFRNFGNKFANLMTEDDADENE